MLCGQQHSGQHAFERLIKTFAQTAAALITSDKVLGILDINWTTVLSVAGLAAIYSLLTSIGSAPIGDEGTPSLTRNS